MAEGALNNAGGKTRLGNWVEEGFLRDALGEDTDTNQLEFNSAKARKHGSKGLIEQPQAAGYQPSTTSSETFTTPVGDETRRIGKRQQLREQKARERAQAEAEAKQEAFRKAYTGEDEPVTSMAREAYGTCSDSTPNVPVVEAEHTDLNAAPKTVWTSQKGNAGFARKKAPSQW
eukprot:m.10781 g.10781  ORF g.10781 m.10781 type:complete len:174 (-) comp3857_c0_seq2:189-710(-)